MRAHFVTLSTGIRALQQQLDLLSSVRMSLRRLNKTLDGREDPLTRLLGSFASGQTHGFYYAAVIVSLYGLLEEFVENLLSETVQRVAAVVPSYGAMPDAVKNNHLRLTLEVLNRLSTTKYQNRVEAATLIAGLHSCFLDEANFSMNDVVFAHHSANFRADVIRQSFEQIGVRLDGLDQSPTLLEETGTLFPDENDPFFVINDLADRRNEVAHGTPSQLLSVELMTAYLRVTEAYSKALLRHVTSWLIKFSLPHVAVDLGRPTKVFRHQVAGFAAVPARVCVGDMIAVISGSGEADCRSIASIEVNASSVTAAEAGASMGMHIGSPLTPRCRLYLLPNKPLYLLPP